MVYSSGGKIVYFDVRTDLESGVFQELRVLDTFMQRRMIMNGTLAWDIERNGDSRILYRHRPKFIP